ncbi:Hypothetical predicted protein, partial [Paramuricea clavata]
LRTRCSDLLTCSAVRKITFQVCESTFSQILQLSLSNFSPSLKFFEDRLNIHTKSHTDLKKTLAENDYMSKYKLTAFFSRTQYESPPKIDEITKFCDFNRGNTFQFNYSTIIETGMRRIGRDLGKKPKLDETLETNSLHLNAPNSKRLCELGITR